MIDYASKDKLKPLTKRQHRQAVRDAEHGIYEQSIETVLNFADDIHRLFWARKQAA